MIEIRDITGYNITREDIITEAAKLPGGVTSMKERLTWAARRLYFNCVYQQLKDAFAAIRDNYELCNSERADALDTEVWDSGFIAAHKAELPEVYHRCVEEPEGGFPDGADVTDMDGAALQIAGWASEQIGQVYNDRSGQMLSALGVVWTDYQYVVTQEEDAALEEQARTVSGATKTEISQAWRQFGQAMDFDQGELAKALVISRSTLSNYAGGRTPAKCTPEQAVIMAAECRARVALLTAAAEIFQRVK